MAIQFVDGAILFVDGAIAMHEDCCCPCPCFCCSNCGELGCPDVFYATISRFIDGCGKTYSEGHSKKRSKGRADCLSRGASAPRCSPVSSLRHARPRVWPWPRGSSTRGRCYLAMDTFYESFGQDESAHEEKPNHTWSTARILSPCRMSNRNPCQ